MYLEFAQKTITNAVLAITDNPTNATLVELQADVQDIRYTMDDSTDPAVDTGMVLLTTQPPKLFTMEDLTRARFFRGAGSDAELLIHYLSGRDV